MSSATTPPSHRTPISTQLYNTPLCSSTNSQIQGSDNGSGVVETPLETRPSARARDVLQKIIQNFHTKSALVVLYSRMPLPAVSSKIGEMKINKWFQLQTDDTLAFRKEFRHWQAWTLSADVKNQEPPPPLILETFLSLKDVQRNGDVLSIVNTKGEAVNVEESLRREASNQLSNRDDIVLERWRFQFEYNGTEPDYDLEHLPSRYKSLVVFMRSVYTMTRILPAWRLSKALVKNAYSEHTLRIQARIIAGNRNKEEHLDPLKYPLCGDGYPVTTEFELEGSKIPLGNLSGKVEYRNNCDFKLSMETYFPREVKSEVSAGLKVTYRHEAGGSSLPPLQRIETPDLAQAYGSLSTWHIPTRCESPVSALRAAPVWGLEYYTSSPEENQNPLNFGNPPQSVAAPTPVTNFKAPQAQQTHSPVSSGNNRDRGRPGSRSSSVHSRGSSGRSGSPASLRGVSVAPIEFVESAPGSPVLRTSYSNPDLQNWSGIKAEHSRRTSFVSQIGNDDDAIADFLKLLDAKKGLSSAHVALPTVMKTETSALYDVRHRMMSTRRPYELEDFDVGDVFDQMRSTGFQDKGGAGGGNAWWDDGRRVNAQLSAFKRMREAVGTSMEEQALDSRRRDGS